MSAGVGAIDGLDSMMAEGQAATEERLREHIDDRMTAIARLIRSDNQILAEAFKTSAAAPAETVDPALLRQTMLAIKELQAGLANDVRTAVDRRFESINDQMHKESQSTTESMVKVAEVLGDKIDRLSVRVDEGYGNDLQIVIDRMGDAIQAMSSVRRTA
jgi:fumarylacetoacetate (FAA) hydrolase family protein